MRRKHTIDFIPHADFARMRGHMAKSKYEQTLQLFSDIRAQADRCIAQCNENESVPLFDAMKLVSMAQRLAAMFEVKKEVSNDRH